MFITELIFLWLFTAAKNLELKNASKIRQWKKIHSWKTNDSIHSSRELFALIGFAGSFYIFSPYVKIVAVFLNFSLRSKLRREKWVELKCELIPKLSFFILNQTSHIIHLINEEYKILPFRPSIIWVSSYLQEEWELPLMHCLRWSKITQRRSRLLFLMRWKLLEKSEKQIDNLGTEKVSSEKKSIKFGV